MDLINDGLVLLVAGAGAFFSMTVSLWSRGNHGTWYPGFWSIVSLGVGAASAFGLFRRDRALAVYALVTSFALAVFVGMFTATFYPQGIPENETRQTLIRLSMASIVLSLIAVAVYKFGCSLCNKKDALNTVLNKIK
jgi:hypothetical protein